MTAEKRQTDTVEFQRDAIRRVTVHGYGVAEAARNVGLNATMLGRWTREPEARENGAVPGKGRLPPDQEEIPRLRQENKRRRMERASFNKAAAFFANESR
jgi:transposase